MFSELEEMVGSGSAMKGSYHDFDKYRAQSTITAKSIRNNLPDSLFRSTRFVPQKHLDQDYKNSEIVSSTSTKRSLSNVPDSTVLSSGTKAERKLDQDYKKSKTVPSASTRSSLSKIPKSTERTAGTKAERELDGNYKNSETASSTKSSYDNIPDSTVSSSRIKAERELDQDYNNSKTVSSVSKNKGSVLLENEIFNKHGRQSKESPERILKAPDVKIEFDAKQETGLQGLVERLLSPIYTDDDNQEDIIFVKVTEKEILEARDRILRESLRMEQELEERQTSEPTKSIQVQSNSKCQIGTVGDCQAETRIPLMDETTASADLKDKSEGDEKKSVDIHLSEIRKELRDRRNSDVGSKERSSCRSIVLSSLCFAVLSIVPIAMVLIGSLYLKECHVQPYIPIYLVVGGAFGIFYSFISVYRRNSKSASYNVFDGVMNLFFVIWFIIGCIWVYGVKHVEFYVTTDPDYCHSTCYNFTYWLFNVIFILIGASVGMVCCVFCCSSVGKCWKEAHRPVPVGYSSRREWRRAQNYF